MPSVQLLRRLVLNRIDGWQVPAGFQAVHGDIGRDSEEPVREHWTVHPLGLHAELVKLFRGQPLQRRAGDQHAVLVGHIPSP